MAKFRALKGKAKKAPMTGAIPCLVLILSGMALVMLLWYAIVKSAS